MIRHDTPVSVASVLLRHLPRKIGRVLDPSVGTGVLILPLLNRPEQPKITCIDVDKVVLDELKAKTPADESKRMTFVADDFMKWASNTKSRFHCIVMNPPFAAKKSELVHIPLGRDEGESSHVPVESAFVWHAIRLLRPQGRLLAILPPSVISSLQGIHLRKWLLEQGNITYVHELPQRTFPKVETRVYLFVFEKGMPGKSLMVCNHDLQLPERRRLQLSELGTDFRFDFNSCITLRHLGRIESAQFTRWVMLSEIASVYRGSARSPKGKSFAIHSTDYSSGFWNVGRRHRRLKPKTRHLVLSRGDILLQRVGRGCAKKLGIVAKHKSVALSDCMLVIRPKNPGDQLRLLFAMRCLGSSGQLERLLERGGGASYITMHDLLRLRVPIGIADQVPEHFKTYSRSVKRQAHEKMLVVETEAFKVIAQPLHES